MYHNVNPFRTVNLLVPEAEKPDRICVLLHHSGWHDPELCRRCRRQRGSHGVFDWMCHHGRKLDVC